VVAVSLAANAMQAYSINFIFPD